MLTLLKFGLTAIETGEPAAVIVILLGVSVEGSICSEKPTPMKALIGTFVELFCGPVILKSTVGAAVSTVIILLVAAKIVGELVLVIMPSAGIVALKVVLLVKPELSGLTTT